MYILVYYCIRIFKSAAKLQKMFYMRNNFRAKMFYKGNNFI